MKTKSNPNQIQIKTKTPKMTEVLANTQDFSNLANELDIDLDTGFDMSIEDFEDPFMIKVKEITKEYEIKTKEVDNSLVKSLATLKKKFEDISNKIDDISFKRAKKTR